MSSLLHNDTITILFAATFTERHADKHLTHTQTCTITRTHAPPHTSCPYISGDAPPLRGHLTARNSRTRDRRYDCLISYPGRSEGRSGPHTGYCVIRAYGVGLVWPTWEVAYRLFVPRVVSGARVEFVLT